VRLLESPRSEVPDPTAPTLRVVVIDDHRLLAQSLALALRLEGIATTVPVLGDPAALLRDTAECRPDLVLLDLDLGGAIGDGSLLVPLLAAAGWAVLVVSGSTDDEQLARALDHGAIGVLRKDVPFEELLGTVMAGARGEPVMDAGHRLRLLARARQLRGERERRLAPLERLSPREAGVLRALAEGLSVVRICETAHVSEATVRSQVRAVLTKLGVSSQLEAVALAHAAGWV
jgi:two-component system nitrate/nitrite response regulator NarL